MTPAETIFPPRITTAASTSPWRLEPVAVKVPSLYLLFTTAAGVAVGAGRLVAGLVALMDVGLGSVTTTGGEVGVALGAGWFSGALDCTGAASSSSPPSPSDRWTMTGPPPLSSDVWFGAVTS